MSIFKRRNIEQFTNSLAAYLPGGPLFASKTVQNSNFRKLLRGLASELFNVNGFLKAYSEEIIPDKTVKFIAEWESALGIPDECFSNTGSIDERRRNVLVKLASLGVQTAADFEALADIFGVDVEVNPGSAHGTFPMLFPIILFDTQKDARFTIVVTFTVTASRSFPYEFPFIFGNAEIPILECLFTKLKPANCDIIFRQIDDEQPQSDVSNFRFQDNDNFEFQDGINFEFN